MAGQFVAVAKAADIAEGQFKVVDVKGKRLLICHANGGWYAVDDTCTHDDGPLGDGWLDGTTIECPRHGARFDVKTGKVVCLPAAVPINSYAVKVDGVQVLVNLDEVIQKNAQ